jgi:membrane-bound lytic murein transglycosylase D
MLMILTIAGSRAAYPQYIFPNHLSEAKIYWEQQYLMETISSAVTIDKRWDDLGQSDLSSDQARSLHLLLNVWGSQLESLPKADQDFAEKYVHLALYLSGINPMATSTYDRTGPWMLTFPDARRYGLVVNDWIDERRDLAKSTRAARLLFQNLKSLHGENTEIAFVLGAAGSIRASKEQLDMIEADLTALRLLAKNIPEGKLIATEKSGIGQSFQEEIDLTVLLATLSMSETAFRQQNPTIIGDRIPAGVVVKLPMMLDGHALAEQTRMLAVAHKRAQDSLMHRIKNDIPSPESHQVVSYRVKSGDVLGKIASRHGVTVAKIKKWNNLRSDRIDINQRLTIYMPKGKAVAAEPAQQPTTIVSEKASAESKADEQGKFTIYEVLPGDTLWAISKRFEGVKPEQIMAWNGIGEDLSIGQKLKIKVQ